MAVLTMLGPVAVIAADDLADLGEALFFDTNLSLNRTQSCATCHNPAAAFTDSRENATGRAVSLGDDGKSLGDRNTPSITYASLIPDFERDESGIYAGGAFYDGRAADLVDQAGQPFTNPIEMNLPDAAAVVERVMENSSHVTALKHHFGVDIFDDTDAAFRAIRESIVAFERTPQFAPFDSKYDRFLRGEVELTVEEELGRKLFYSRIFNCHDCHLIDQRELQAGAAFTTHRYHNIGVPANQSVRARNGLGASHRDLGLLENPAIDDPAEAGKFKVPTLRNVAVTAPYMHNGVFNDLETVIVFYNKFILTNPESQTNPETGQPWQEPEVPETVDLELLEDGQPVAPLQVSALVAFLRALTDQRYEHLLEDMN
ncbi:MAG: methylamine utilization protein MauG [Gammaproteobacteria bacterium]|nr:methylamine utilization protein MauG [Gammaproteobacteria bacterium]